VWLVAGADALMIATGYLGTLESTPAARLAWFTLSAVLFVAPVVALARCAGGAKFKNTPAVILTLVVWLLYPVLWLLQYAAPAGHGMRWDTANAWTAVLDVIAKVGFGILFAA
jgi:bacteriorhodopsin